MLLGQWAEQKYSHQGLFLTLCLNDFVSFSRAPPFLAAAQRWVSGICPSLLMLSMQKSSSLCCVHLLLLSFFSSADLCEGSRCPNGATKTRHRRYSFHCCLIQCVITRGAQRSFSTDPCEVLGSVWCNCCFSVEAGCCEGSQHYLLDVRIPGELGWSKGNHWTTEFGSIAGHCKTNLLHRT